MGPAPPLTPRPRVVARSSPRSTSRAGDPDPLIGFPGHTKFFLLRNLGNTYLQRLGDGSVCHAESATNDLTSAVVRDVIGSLLAYGFQSTIGKVQALLGLLVKLLDG